MKKKDILSSFEDTQVVYLATADKKGQPFVRPITLIIHNKKFWIATGSKDKKMSQISENPRFEFCVPIFTEDNGGYYRFSGDLVISRSLAEKTMIHEEVDFIKMFWEDPADKDFGLIKVIPKQIEYMRPGSANTKHYQWENLK